MEICIACKTGLPEAVHGSHLLYDSEVKQRVLGS